MTALHTLRKNGRLSEEQILKGIADFRMMFPDDHRLKATKNEELTAKVHQFVHSDRIEKVIDPTVTVARMKRMTQAQLSLACPMAIGTVVFDCVTLFLGFVGLHLPVGGDAEAKAIQDIAEIAEKSLPGWKVLIQDFQKADSLFDKAKAIFKIASTAWTAGMMKGIIGQIRDLMTWWDWVITGVAALAQIAALVLTDGGSFVAELVGSAASLAQLGSDIPKAVEACSSSSKAHH